MSSFIYKREFKSKGGWPERSRRTEKNRNKIYTGENELSKIKGKREKKEIREFQAETARQYEKNKKHYEQNYSILSECQFEDLQKKLKICLRGTRREISRESSSRKTKSTGSVESSLSGRSKSI